MSPSEKDPSPDDRRIRVEYGREHWEALMGTVLERVGFEQFVEIIDYVLEQHGKADAFIAHD